MSGWGGGPCLHSTGPAARCPALRMPRPPTRAPTRPPHAPPPRQAVLAAARCGESASASIQLGVVRALLTFVTAEHFLVSPLKFPA